MSRLVVVWWVFAFVYSAVRGWMSHVAPGGGGPRPKAWTMFHQFVFNFLGAIVGCAAFYLLFLKVSDCFGGACAQQFELTD